MVEGLRGDVGGIVEERCLQCWRNGCGKLSESHKPVETGDLRAQSDSRSGEAGKVQDGPPRPSGAILEAGKGNLAA